jgi:2-polyprenyl-3-methyl-5-hydroxy-6-metoxy-1,4-benzoquinol methylase
MSMIEVWNSSSEEGPMEDQSLTGLDDLVSTHPWFVARAELVARYLRKHGVALTSSVLDAGCGWGVTVRKLEELGWSPDALDISLAALKRLDNGHRHLVHADLEKSLNPPRNFDVVLALDVIEHIDNDTMALDQVRQCSRPGGLVIVSVPAISQLYSRFDEVQGHRRRYDKKGFRKVIHDAGLEILSLQGWGQLTLPLVLMQRKLFSRGKEENRVYSDFLKLPRHPVPEVLLAMYRFDSRCTIAGYSPFGTSLIAVAKNARR